MSIRTKTEILNALTARFPDNTDDDISLLEDITDTLTDFEEKTSEDWKSKYETNDAEWRKKYTERFMTGAEIKKQQQENIEEDSRPRTFDELFKEREG